MCWKLSARSGRMPWMSPAEWRLHRARRTTRRCGRSSPTPKAGRGSGYGRGAFRGAPSRYDGRLIARAPVAYTAAMMQLPDARGRFGAFGGGYVAETLIPALDELAREYEKARRDAKFKTEADCYLRQFVRRPTPPYCSDGLTK